MTLQDTTLTLIGGPTVLIEIDGWRLLTDPTFDPPGLHRIAPVRFKKMTGPALSAAELGRIDAVMLSHDQHLDNLDAAGGTFLPRAGRVLTNFEGAARLGGNPQGLAPFETVTLAAEGRPPLLLTGSPARHGPPGIDPISGPVIGFLIGRDAPGGAIYVAGDTLWYEGTAEVARRTNPDLVLLFAGSAEPRGSFHMTMDNNDALKAAAALPFARLAVAHAEGCVRFAETAEELGASFTALGPPPGWSPCRGVSRSATGSDLAPRPPGP